MIYGGFMDKKGKRENKKNREEQIEYAIAEVGEDTTKYGEFISSYFAWISLPEQKERVEELQNITKKEKEKNLKNNDKNKDKER